MIECIIFFLKRIALLTMLTASLMEVEARKIPADVQNYLQILSRAETPSPEILKAEALVQQKKAATEAASQLQKSRS